MNSIIGNNHRSSPEEAFRTIPPTTLAAIVVCCSVHAIRSTLGWNLHLFTMCPRLVLFAHEYYRVVTSVFVHANLMHIGMNMLSTVAIGSALETQMGTLRLLFSIGWAVLLTSAMYIGIAYTASLVVGYDAWMYQHALGFSGILFHLSVLESRLHPGLPRRVFGCVSVPAVWYPWVLLVLLQVIVPNLSFLGHLSGILHGTLEYYGVLDVLFVGDSFLVHLESLPVMRKVVAMESFVGTTATQTSAQRLRAESSPLPLPSLLSWSLPSTHLVVLGCQSIRRTLSVVSRFVKDVGIRFWERRRSTGNDTDTTTELGVIRPPEFYDGSLYDDDDDEEELGLPLVSQIV